MTPFFFDLTIECLNIHMKMCYHPWVGLDISPQGKFKPCCKYQNSIANNFDDYWDSPELKELRQAFERGEQPVGCARCWRDEELGLPSKREMDWEYHFKKQKPNLDSIKILSVAFGNTCNLACRTCSSYSSSRWAQEARKLDLAYFEHQRFYKDAKFMQDLKHCGETAIHIDIPGGEPFLHNIPEHQNFLDHLIDTRAELPTLHYTTNCTTWPAKLVEAWQHFPEVDIQLSLDGVEKKFEYIRWPAKWKGVKENIQRFIELRDRTDNIKLSVSHTISVYNALDLDDFKLWCDEMNLPHPYVGLVTNPDYLNINCLPDEVKKYISLDTLPGTAFNMFMKHVQMLDQSRGESFQKTFPELWELIPESYKDA